MSIGERIKEARKKAGLKQSELAEKLGVAVITIGQYERGVRQPRLEQFQRIAAALNVDVNWLMNGQTLEQRDQAMRNYVDRRFAEVKDAEIIHQGDEKPKISNAEMAERMASAKHMAVLFSEFAKELKGLRDASPDVFEKAGFSLEEVNEDIARMEDWAEVFTSILILGGFSEEGAKKVTSYAEDILPRYQRTTAPQSTPAPPEGTDTAKPTDAPETPPEGK